MLSATRVGDTSIESRVALLVRDRVDRVATVRIPAHRPRLAERRRPVNGGVDARPAPLFCNLPEISSAGQRSV